MLSTREIATLIWFGVLMIYVLSKRDIRKSMYRVFEAFIKIILNVIGGFILLYLGCIVAIAYRFNMLNFTFSKNYLVWIFFGLFPLLYKTVTDSKFSIRQLFFDMLTLSIIPIYIVNEYTFALSVEIILLPTVVILTMIISLADIYKKNVSAKKILEPLLTIIGLLVGFYAFRSFIYNYKDASEAAFWKNMFIDVLFVFSHIPMLIVVRLAAAYEQVMIRTKFRNKLSKSLALLIVCFYCNVKIVKLSKLKTELRFGRLYTLKEFNSEIKRVLG